jgi:hypothetical protein
VLGTTQISRLRAAVSSLEKALAQAVRKKGLTLLTSDVEETLDAARGIVGEGGRRAADPTLDVDRLLAALDSTRDERTGLSFVPNIMTRLSPALPVAVAQEVLLTAARRELIELRPEGGLERLTPEELSLCPPGPGGTRLSWARRLEGEAS